MQLHSVKSLEIKINTVQMQQCVGKPEVRRGPAWRVAESKMVRSLSDSDKLFERKPGWHPAKQHENTMELKLFAPLRSLHPLHSCLESVSSWRKGFVTILQLCVRFQFGHVPGRCKKNQFSATAASTAAPSRYPSWHGRTLPVLSPAYQ